MKIEHFAYDVTDPVGVAAWYVEHLGLRVVRESGPPTHTHFLSDDAGGILEIYNNSAVVPPDYAAMNPLLLHVAFAVEDLAGTRARLLGVGCSSEGEIAVMPNGDELAMLRDPWGFALQLTKRGQAFA